MNVGDADVEEAADVIGVARRLERHRRLVIGRWPPALMMIQLFASATIDGSASSSISPPSTSA